MAQGFLGKILGLFGLGGSSASETADKMSRRASDAASQVSKKAHDLAESGAEVAREVASQAEKLAESGVETARNLSKDAREMIDSGIDNAKAVADDIGKGADAAMASAGAAARSAAASARHTADEAIAGLSGSGTGTTEKAASGNGKAGARPVRKKTEIRLTVNGRAKKHKVEDRMLLVEYLRDQLNLTGTHVGCDTSQCGACVIHVNGKAVKACTMLAVQADGADITTIEGLAGDGELHPMQAAFRENHGLQCGFCTPGMIMTAVDMVNRLGPGIDEKTIRHQLEGNICRCTGYHNIVKSIAAGASAMGGSAKQAAE